MKQISGAQILLQVLRQKGISTFFGVPGSPMLPFYDELYKAGSEVRTILVRHLIFRLSEKNLRRPSAGGQKEKGVWGK